MAKKLGLVVLLMISASVLVGSDEGLLGRDNKPPKSWFRRKVLTCRNAERCAWVGGVAVIAISAYTTATVCREMQPACEDAYKSLSSDEGTLREMRNDLAICTAALNYTKELFCKFIPGDCA